MFAFFLLLEPCRIFTSPDALATVIESRKRKWSPGIHLESHHFAVNDPFAHMPFGIFPSWLQSFRLTGTLEIEMLKLSLYVLNLHKYTDWFQTNLQSLPWRSLTLLIYSLSRCEVSSPIHSAKDASLNHPVLPKWPFYFLPYCPLCMGRAPSQNL